MRKRDLVIAGLALAAAICLAVGIFRGSVMQTGSWGLSFRKEGTAPVGNAGVKQLKAYDAAYLGDTSGKTLYLTFDAGYENGNVAKVLDTLQAENVPGAFFILEGLVKHDPALVERMEKEGHLVCNHTASHRDMTKVDNIEDFRAELCRMETVYTELTGKKLSPYYRPPEGKISERSMAFAKECGYSTIFWSFAYSDWDNQRQMDPEKAKEKILSETHNGAVVLLHPTSATNAAILGDLIHAWREMGFRFGTLDELTGKDDHVCAKD